jgi:hypothetical protein
MNFEQILRQKLQENTSQTSSVGNEKIRGTDPAHLAFLIGRIARLQSAHPAKSPYKPSISPRKTHELTLSQQEAFAFFTKHQPDLSDAFTRNEIKSAFRKIAFVTHPDQGGTAEEFMQLREHYKTLINVPKK